MHGVISLPDATSYDKIIYATSTNSFKNSLHCFFYLYPFIFISQINLASFTGSSATGKISRLVHQPISLTLSLIFGDVSVAQLVASASGVVLGGVAEVVGSNLAKGKIFTASIGSVDSLYPSVYIYIYIYIYIQ